MNQTIVFDISALIWDRTHFEVHEPEYYNVMKILPNLFTQILLNAIPVQLRGEFSLEIYTYFPYDIIPNDFYAFQTSALLFLSNCKMVDYPSMDNVTVISEPNLVKHYYQDSIKEEVRYLITHLYKQNRDDQKILSFSLFWEGGNSLILRNGHEVSLKTILCDDQAQHETIIAGLKKVFEHNPKHNAFKSSIEEYRGVLISQLSCYNERIGDTSNAQKLLDNAVQYLDKGY